MMGKGGGGSARYRRSLPCDPWKRRWWRFAATEGREAGMILVILGRFCRNRGKLWPPMYTGCADMYSAPHLRHHAIVAGRQL